MGDWAVTHHFVIAPAELPTVKWRDDRWAMRVGALGPRLRLVQTLQKYGYAATGSHGVIAVCAGYDYLGGTPTDAFQAACNYVLADQPDARRVLERAAVPLGTRATLADSSSGLLLCLGDTIRFEQPRRDWTSFEEVDPLGELAGTLAAALTGAPTELVLGLWTEAHGYVHTGGVDLTRAGHGPATASFRATGGYNPLRAAWSGPYAGSIYVRDHERPRSLPTSSWPMGQRRSTIGGPPQE